MLAYIIALTIIAILLFSAVGLHLFFGFHHVVKVKANVEATNIGVKHVANTSRLHELIFSKY